MLGWICSIGVEKVIKPRELLVSSNLALEKTRDLETRRKHVIWKLGENTLFGNSEKTRDLETRRKTDVFLLEIYVLSPESFQ